jgi:predicted transposase YbfD/YdcC
MNSTMFIRGISLPSAGVEIKPQSLCGALRSLGDKRGRQGRRYRAEVVLTLLLLAKLAGQTEIVGIAEWVRLRGSWLTEALGIGHRQLPCANTYRYVCQKIDLAQLNRLLADFFNRLRADTTQTETVAPPTAGTKSPPPRGSRHLALDGKTLRGTLGADRPAENRVHLLELYDVERGIVLNQKQVQHKTNEISWAAKLLNGQHLRGCLISADALHTQTQWCRKLRRVGADYLLTAKTNQRELASDLAFLFEGEWPAYLERQRAESLDKGHGRIEQRRITVSSELNDFLAKKWHGVAQVFKLERWITIKGKTRYEVVYGLTSLPIELAGPARLLQLVRDHWRIENRLHWRKDVTLKEDSCRVHTGQIPKVLAALNNAVLSFMDYLAVGNLPSKMRQFEANPLPALALLLG